MIVSNSALFDKLTVYVLCPEAVDHSLSDYGSSMIDPTNPSGGTGRYTELTFTYQDGLQKVFPNDEVGLKGLGASFALAGFCGGLGVLFFVILAAIVGARLVKPKESRA